MASYSSHRRIIPVRSERNGPAFGHFPTQSALCTLPAATPPLTADVAQYFCSFPCKRDSIPTRSREIDHTQVRPVTCRTFPLSTHAEIDNIDRVKKGFEAFAASDMATPNDIFDADARWRSEPTGILAGNYDGRHAIFAMFAQVGQETAGTFRSIPSTMAASGDKVFVQCDVTGDRKGRKLKADEVLIFRLADGRVREVRLYQAEAAQSAVFWA